MNLRKIISSKLKSFVLWPVSPKNTPIPRTWVRWFLNPLIHKKGKEAKIRRRRRIYVFPWKRFEIGSLTTIEDFSPSNNGAGDVILGNRVRVGIGSVIIDPITMEDSSVLDQHVFAAGFNHGYSNGTKSSLEQPLDVRSTFIKKEVLIGSNSVILPGIEIGKRSRVGAGNVVTKDIPPFSVAVDNPAKVIKKFNPKNNSWKKHSVNIEI